MINFMKYKGELFALNAQVYMWQVPPHYLIITYKVSVLENDGCGTVDSKRHQQNFTDFTISNF